MIKTRLPLNRRRRTRECVTLVFSFCDLDLDPMTLICEVNLDILKMYPRTKKEISRSRLSNVRAWTKQTDRQTRPKALQAGNRVKPGLGSEENPCTLCSRVA